MADIIQDLGGMKTSAELIDVTDEQLRKWRDGKARPSLFAVAKLADSARVSLDWLVRGNGDKKRATKNAVDLVILSAAIQVVEETLLRNGIKDADPHKKAELIKGFYSLQIHDSIPPGAAR